MPFDGKTYNREVDQDRLWSALNAVKDLMADGEWRTLQQIRTSLSKKYSKSVSESGVSARLRDLRKLRFGGFDMQSRRREGGPLWEYKLDVQSEFPFKKED
jgi:hypothetical protein